MLLNANVAFLAIPSVDSNQNSVTPAQIASYLSIITSVGSILLGLLLIRQHRVKAKETADDAVSPELPLCFSASHRCGMSEHFPADAQTHDARA